MRAPECVAGAGVEEALMVTAEGGPTGGHCPGVSGLSAHVGTLHAHRTHTRRAHTHTRDFGKLCLRDGGGGGEPSFSVFFLF